MPKNAPGVEDLPVFAKTLCNVEDTPELLQLVTDEITDQYGLSKECGGARHPTALIAMRTIDVVERKLELVRAVSSRGDLVQAAWDRRREIVKEVAQNTREAPLELLGLAAFIKKYVHPGGDPMEADKSDFLSFCSSFGLPQKHQCVARLRNLMADFSDFLAVATLEQANSGLDVDGIMRLLELCKSMTGGKKSPAMEEASKAICDAIADQVLVFAKEMKKKDDFAVSRSEVPQVESARKCAKDVNAQIKEAILMGCETSHPALSEAKVLATELEVECKSRIALKAQIHAKLQLVRDDKEVEIAGEGGIVEVGSATRMAEGIDDAVKKSVKEGAQKVHEFIQEAEEIAKELRQRDGERKRMKARQERMAKQAADAKKGKKKKKGGEDEEDDED